MKTQNGMVLLLCLIFLTALTLLGLSASAEAILQNKLSANLRESEYAKQSALSALSFAENWLLSLEGLAPEICNTTCIGLKLHASDSLPGNPEFKDLSWWEAQGHEAGVDPLTAERTSHTTATGISPSFWVIEVIHERPSPESESIDLQVWYRILARGSGRTTAGVSVVESIVVRAWSAAESPETTKHGRVAWRELR